MELDIFFAQITAYMLVFARVAGMIVFNPVLSRQNLPNQFRVALILGLTLLLTPGVMGDLPLNMSTSRFVLGIGLELMVGATCGFVFQLFYYLLFMVGDVIDMGFGLSMAKAFDPGSNMQVSFSGNMFQLFFVLYVFLTDGHLLLIRLTAASYDLVAIGGVTFGPDVISFILTLFVTTFSLAMNLAIPFMAASFTMELTMGILMKLVPQISVFSINFQLKILLGMTLLFLFAGPITQFLNSYMNEMFINMQNVFATA